MTFRVSIRSSSREVAAGAAEREILLCVLATLRVGVNAPTDDDERKVHTAALAKTFMVAKIS